MDEQELEQKIADMTEADKKALFSKFISCGPEDISDEERAIWRRLVEHDA